MRERGLSVHARDIASLPPGSLRNFDCLVAGDEFCQLNLPSSAELRALKKKFAGKIILATPPLTEAGFGRAEALAAGWIASEDRPELIVNDIGLLSVLLQRYAAGRLRVSIGRFLSRALGFSKSASFFARVLSGRAKSFEADNLEFLDASDAIGDAAVSFHLPLEYVCMTRFCSFAGQFNTSCRRECGSALLPLRNKAVRKPLYVRGNAYFSSNSAALAACGGLRGLLSRYPRVKRVVFDAAALRGGLAGECAL